jgi:hypothetical protein
MWHSVFRGVRGLAGASECLDHAAGGGSKTVACALVEVSIHVHADAVSLKCLHGRCW